MKSKLPLQFPAILCLLGVSLAASLAQGGPGFPGAPNPNTGISSPPPRPWKDPDWKDPNLTLTNVNYDNLPLDEIASDLRKQFNDAFDVLIPNGWSDPNSSVESPSPRGEQISLRLRNVAASEVFNAMNLLLETENVPMRWELIMNGKRPVAVLRLIPELMARTPPTAIDPTTGLPIQPPETKRTVYFVGDLIGDEKAGGMTLEQVVKTISEVSDMAYGKAGMVQFHKEAQLLVVTGTPDQIEFVHQALGALRQKVVTERKSAAKDAETKTKPEPISASPASSKSSAPH
jgi:hypothetical protein